MKPHFRFSDFNILQIPQKNKSQFKGGSNLSSSGTKLVDFCANQFLVKCPQYFVRRNHKNCPLDEPRRHMARENLHKLNILQFKTFSFVNKYFWYCTSANIDDDMITRERQGEGSTMCGFIKLWQEGSETDCAAI